MALTLAKVTDFPNQPQMIGQYRAQWYDVTFDNSYATGGLALTPAQVGMQKVLGAIPMNGGVLVAYDAVNSKLKAFTGAITTAAPTEVTNTTDMHSVTVRLQFIGL